MIDQKKIDRINELARKSKTPEGLTDGERREQAQLRREYIEAYKSSLRNALEHTTVIEPDGTRQKLSEMRKTQKKHNAT